MAGDQESIQDLTDLLNDEGEETEQEQEEEENLEVEDPEEEEPEIEEEEEEKEKGIKDEKIEIPQFKAITKKYPELFKEFPHLRHAFYHNKEYRELFPTLEDAKEAVESLENLKDLETAVSSGEIGKILDSFKNVSEEALPTFAQGFLSSLRKVDQDLYYNVITPELVNFTRSMYAAGVRNENDNLKNAALVAGLHYFGDPKVASGEKEVKLNNKGPAPKDDKLEQERKAFKNEKYTSFYNDVVSYSDNQLNKLVVNGLDPKKNMSDGMKEIITEKVMKEITNTLSANPSHTRKMNSLWKKANDSGFSSEHKRKIVAAYLESAKEVMPKIRAKVRASVLGIRERPSENRGDVRERIEPRSNAGGQRQSSSSSKNIDAKKVDWKRTSDLDFLKDKVTLKS